MEQATCPECEQQVGVTKASLLYKHATDEGPCPGSGKAVQQGDQADDGEDWLGEEPAETGDGEQEPGTGFLAGLADQDHALGDALGAVATKALAEERPDTYTWHLRVSLPALWLDDPDWHQQNELMAVKWATDAGCAVTGEARWDRLPDYRADGSLVIAYLVPIKS